MSLIYDSTTLRFTIGPLMAFTVYLQNRSKFTHGNSPVGSVVARL